MAVRARVLPSGVVGVAGVIDHTAIVVGFILLAHVAAHGARADRYAEIFAWRYECERAGEQIAAEALLGGGRADWRCVPIYRSMPARLVTPPPSRARPVTAQPGGPAPKS